MKTHLKEEYNGTWAEQTIIVRGTEPARTEAACSAGGGFLLLRFFPLPFSFYFFLIPLFPSSSSSFLRFSLSRQTTLLQKNNENMPESLETPIKWLTQGVGGMPFVCFWDSTFSCVIACFESTLIFSTQLLDLIYIRYFRFILLSIISFDLNVLI